MDQFPLEVLIPSAGFVVLSAAIAGCVAVRQWRAEREAAAREADEPPPEEDG